MTHQQLRIEGMSCPACANRVARALREVPGVREAHVSHTEGTALVEHDGTPTGAALVDAVTRKGYAARLDAGA